MGKSDGDNEGISGVRLAEGWTPTSAKHQEDKPRRGDAPGVQAKAMTTMLVGAAIGIAAQVSANAIVTMRENAVGRGSVCRAGTHAGEGPSRASAYQFARRVGRAGCHRPCKVIDEAGVVRGGGMAKRWGGWRTPRQRERVKGGVAEGARSDGIAAGAISEAPIHGRSMPGCLLTMRAKAIAVRKGSGLLPVEMIDRSPLWRDFLLPASFWSPPTAPSLSRPSSSTSVSPLSSTWTPLDQVQTSPCIHL